MKTHLFSILIFCIAFLSSCEHDFDENSNPLEEETPEVLVDNSTYETPDLVSLKRGNKSLIDNLFREALAKNKHLDSLMKRIRTLNDEKNDALKDYSRFKSKNETFYEEVSRALQSIQDSVFRASIEKYFNQSQQQHLDDLATHDSTATYIDTQVNQIQTFAILIRLFTTEKMMRNYQQNELPNLEDLKTYDETLKDLLEEAEELAKPLE